MTKRQAQQADQQIEAYYYRTYSGVQINVLDIGKIFQAGRQAIANGEPFEPAVDAVVTQIRRN